MKTKNLLNKISASIVVVFASITLFMSSAVIFDWFGIRAQEGNYVLFIVWANFISGFLYIVAAYYLFKNKRNAFPIFLFVLILLIIAFIALQFHIQNDGLYEAKTVKAMLFRIGFTSMFTFVALLNIKKLK